jgi:hypothetical protein
MYIVPIFLWSVVDSHATATAPGDLVGTTCCP